MGSKQGRRPQPGTMEALATDLTEARDMLRQLHEAAKDNRQLLRELSEVRAAIGDDARRHAQDMVKAQVGELEAALRKEVREAGDAFAAVQATIREQTAKLAGQTTPDAFLCHVIDGLKPVIADVVNAAVSAHLNAQFGAVDVEACAAAAASGRFPWSSFPVVKPGDRR